MPDLPRRLSRGAGVAAAVALVALAFAVGVVVALDRHASTTATRGAPAVGGKTAEGKVFDLDDTKGHWVLLNFFASWCTECRTEMPALAVLQHRHPHGLLIVSVDTDDSMASAERLVEQAGGSWVVIDDPDAASTYDVPGLPESFLIDPAGQISHRVVGAVSVAAVTALVDDRA